MQFSINPRNLDPEGEQENDDVEKEAIQNTENKNDSVDVNMNDNELGFAAAMHQIRPSISNETLFEMITSLNTKQREIFEVVNKWVRGH